MEPQKAKKTVGTDKPVFVNTGYQRIRIDLEDIVKVESDGSYCTLYMVGGKQYELSHLLGDLELPEERFVRVSRSAIVNIWRVQMQTGRTLTMDDGSHVKMGETYADALDGHRYELVVHTTRKAGSQRKKGGSAKKMENGTER